MEKRKLNIDDNEYDYYIDEYYSDSQLTDLNIYFQILSNKSLYFITNQNHSNHIKLSPSSLKKILLLGKLEPNEHILFCYYKDNIPDNIKENSDNIIKNQKNNLDKKGKNIKKKLRSGKKQKEKKENKENDDIVLNVSSPDQLLRDDQNENNNINNVFLNNYSESNGVIYDPELDLLNNKSNENLLKIGGQQNNYLLFIYNNKIKITNDNLKCFYLSLFFCGLIYIIYFLDVLIDKNKTMYCIYNVFCALMSILLILTGLYGYNKINKKIYDDKICFILTFSCIISTFINFILSRLSAQENVRNNIIMSVFINLITLFFSGACAYILYELQKKKNKSGLLFEKINAV